jgi:hypothetical protein
VPGNRPASQPRKQRAAARGNVKGRSKMGKAELKRAVQGAGEEVVEDRTQPG